MNSGIQVALYCPPENATHQAAYRRQCKEAIEKVLNLLERKSVAPAYCHTTFA